MAWFKVDDGFNSHPKVIQIPRTDDLRALAAGTWTLCGTWSSKHRLDGYVPDYAIEEAGGTVAGADALVAVKLWHRRKGGYRFHNWAEFQPTRAEMEEASEKERVRKAKYRARLNGNDGGGKSAEVPPGQKRNPDTPTRPDPTRTTSKEVVKDSPLRGTRLPSDWLPPAALVAVMKGEAPAVDLKAEHLVFVDYWIAQAGQKGVRTNWEAVWRNWMRRAQKDAAKSKPAPEQRARSTVALATELLGIEP